MQQYTSVTVVGISFEGDAVSLTEAILEHETVEEVTERLRDQIDDEVGGPVAAKFTHVHRVRLPEPTIAPTTEHAADAKPVTEIE